MEENKIVSLKSRLTDYISYEPNFKPQYPKNMLVELTNICNHNCVFCANKKMTRKHKIMKDDFMYWILKEAYELGTREIGFYATGEPLLAPNLLEAVKYSKELGYEYIYITSNGAMATLDKMIPLIENGLNSIKFSINAGTRDTYKFIHGKDDFDIVIDNLIKLSHYREINGKEFKIFVSYIATKQSYKEKNIIKKLISDYIDDIIFLNVKNQCGVMYEINKLLRVDKEPSGEQLIPCPLLFKSFHITCEGYLTACCADFQNYLVVANLNKVSLKDAWHGEKFVNLRKMHMHNKIDDILCYNCVNNTNKNIEPLIYEYSTKIDFGSFDSSDDVRNRLNNYENGEK